MASRPDARSSRTTATCDQEEQIRILARPRFAGGGVQSIAPGELAAQLADDLLWVWIDVLYPGEQAADMLRSVVGVGPLALEDFLVPQRMPKVDVLEENGGAFVAAFGVGLEKRNGPRLRPIEVDLIVRPASLLTVRSAPLPQLEQRIEALLGTDAGLGEHGGAELAHAALDALIDAHLPTMLRAADVAEQLDEQLDPLADRASLPTLEQLVVLRRDLLAFRRLAVAQQEVLRRLERLAPELAPYFSDVGDNEREAIEMADVTRDYIDGAIEGYRMRRDERSGGDIRRLTVLAAIIGPMSLLTGLYGVNFTNIPGVDYPWGFAIFVGVLLTLASLSVLVLRRRRLL